MLAYFGQARIHSPVHDIFIDWPAVTLQERLHLQAIAQRHQIVGQYLELEGDEHHPGHNEHVKVKGVASVKDQQDDRIEEPDLVAGRWGRIEGEPQQPGHDFQRFGAVEPPFCGVSQTERIEFVVILSGLGYSDPALDGNREVDHDPERYDKDYAESLPVL